MSTQNKKNKRSGDLIPDINKVEELKGAKKKVTKKEEEEVRRTGPKTSRAEEKDPNEYPMRE